MNRDTANTPTTPPGRRKGWTPPRVALFDARYAESNPGVGADFDGRS